MTNLLHIAPGVDAAAEALWTFLALSPVEKWSALRKLGPSALGSGQWFTVLTAIIVIVLLAVLIKVSFNRIQEEKARAEEHFLENVRRRHLSVREYHMLRAIFEKSGLRRHDQIFKDVKAFERGAAQVVADQIAEHGQGMEPRVQAELEFLKEKLGFTGLEIAEPELLRPKTKSRGKGSHKLTTRDIPLGKPLTITRRLGATSSELRATIIDNNDVSLTITLDAPIKVTFGEMWRAHYQFGASVWEFDTTVVSFDGDRLVLRHSDDVRFINRRRFARVPANNIAFISRFPFTKEINTDSLDDWKPIEFVPAVVTELAGPGLRVDAALEVSMNERILVVFKLEQDAAEFTPEEEEAPPSRIIEDIGIVRRVEPKGDTLSIGIELIGLSDADIDELVKVTNLGAVLSRQQNSDPPIDGETDESAGLAATVAGQP